MPREPTPKQKRLQARQRFQRARLATGKYEKQLSQVARHIGTIIKGHVEKDGTVRNPLLLNRSLEKYGEVLHPWAVAVTARMQSEVDQRDELAWTEAGQEMGRNLRAEIQKAKTGNLLRDLLSEQVDLITSLPQEAARRVHRLTLQGLEDSTRAPEIRTEILRSGQVTVARAQLIARTEVARTASTLTQARAEYIGSEGYIWRTSKDTDVRPLHKKLEGKFVKWSSPPVAGERGERSHAGQIYNCRCYPEPVIPDV